MDMGRVALCVVQFDVLLSRYFIVVIVFPYPELALMPNVVFGLCEGVKPNRHFGTHTDKTP